MGTGVFRSIAIASAKQPAESRPGASDALGAMRKISGSLDLPLLLIMAALLTFGLIMVFSASPDFSLQHHGKPFQIFLRQIAWVALGVVTAYVLSRIDYHHWRSLILPGMVVTLALLIAVLFIGEEHLNAIRGLLTDQQWEQFAQPIAIELKAGECAFHHPLLVHGSNANHSPRPRRAVVLNVVRDGVCSESDQPLLDGVPPIPKGQKLDGDFFPLLLKI